mmetsp:Transcript_34574/g.97970  ORF Transcript_34574/g.97970 Transcript_34574/m.97970 type:complete len:227 (+) Transcript_34574:458-1138(+)
MALAAAVKSSSESIKRSRSSGTVLLPTSAEHIFPPTGCLIPARATIAEQAAAARTSEGRSGVASTWERWPRSNPASRGATSMESSLSSSVPCSLKRLASVQSPLKASSAAHMTLGSMVLCCLRRRSRTALAAPALSSSTYDSPAWESGSTTIRAALCRLAHAAASSPGRGAPCRMATSASTAPEAQMESWQCWLLEASCTRKSTAACVTQMSTMPRRRVSGLPHAR